MLGECYYNGSCGEKNYEEAVKWYRKAAEQGDADAQKNLGDCYADGDGVEKNYKEAVKWYRKAAELGNDNAQIMLNRIKTAKYIKVGLAIAFLTAILWLLYSYD